MEQLNSSASSPPPGFKIRKTSVEIGTSNPYEDTKRLNQDLATSQELELMMKQKLEQADCVNSMI